MLSFDAAGDAIGGDGGAGALDVRPPTPDSNCGMTSIGGGFVAPQILVLVDRSVANPGQPWANVIVAVSNAVVQNDSRVDWGLYTFPGATPACWAGPVSSAVDVPILPMNGATVAADIRATLTDGNGSPIAAAIGLGADYLGTLGPDRPKFMLLVTDHAPTCAGTFETLSADANQAQADALAALRAAAAAGFKTMVLAPSTTPDVGPLDQLAEAGGLPRSTGLIEFNTETTLADQFETTTPANCVFGLISTPPVPDNVTVTFNGVPVPRDTQHMDGWDYTAPASDIVQFFGDWCTQALDSRSFQVTVLYGCPVPVPLP